MALADLKTGPTPRTIHTTSAGLGLGYVRLEGKHDVVDLVCRSCGRLVYGTAWAEAISNGRGGLDWVAPLCYRCMAREEAGRVTETEPERTSRLAAMAAKLAEFAAKRKARAGPAAMPKQKPKPTLRIRRKRPAAPAAQETEGSTANHP